MDTPEYFSVLLDSPDEPVKRVQVAKLGEFKDKRYGEFEITRDDVASWKKNLDKLPGGEALIDWEHRSERKPRDSKAAGWLSNVDLDGDRVMADIKWTPEGEQSVKTRAYRFFSPVFGPYTNESGQTFDNTLISGALTNKPFLHMPGISLASDERLSEAFADDKDADLYRKALDGELGEIAQAHIILDVSQAERDRAKKAGNSLPDGSYPINNTHQLHSAAILAASGHGNVSAAKALIRRRAKELGVDVTTLPGFGGPAKAMEASDSQHAMATETAIPQNPVILKALGLDENADEATILEAVEALKAPADPEPTEVKSLEEQAKEDGKVVLDAEALDEIKRQATAGATAMKRLHQQVFDSAFDKALAERKVVPAERERLEKVYHLDSDLGLAMMDDREPIMPDKPAGAATIDLTQEDIDPQSVADAGFSPNTIKLDQTVRAYMEKHELPEGKYGEVVEKWSKGEIRL